MGAYSDRVIADGASYYWRLGEPSGTTAVDAVGGANGTISGGVTLGAAGAISDGTTAMTFNGTNRIAISGPVSVPLAVTIEAWAKMTVSAAFRVIFSNRFTDPFPLMFGVQNAALISYADGGTPVQVSITPILTVGLWYHVVLVHTGAICTWYVNGALYGSTAQTRGGTPSPAVAYIAGDNTTNYWNGALDEVAIYPRALTAPEIAAHYTLARQAAHWPGAPWWVQIGGEDALDSYNVWEPITPSNTVNLPRGVTGGIWVGGGGDVAAVMQNGTMPVVLAAVPTGAWLPMAALRINATGTTATGLVALYET